jgi:secernin
MDLIRLALETSQTARQAVELMGELIEGYGQIGSGVPTKSHREGGYDNSFIIADPRVGWVVEAVGKRWAARCISQGYTSISNQPSIRDQWDLASRDLQPFAVEQGWWLDDAQASFDFARAYIDERVPRQVSHIRARRSGQLLAEKAGQITPGWMKRIARDHYEDTFLQGPYFDAADPDLLTLCMHVSPADFTWGIRQARVSPSCPNRAPSCRSFGGLPVRRVMAATSPSSPMGAGCLRWSPTLEHSGIKWWLRSRPNQTRIHPIPIGGSSDG